MKNSNKNSIRFPADFIGIAAVITATIGIASGTQAQTMTDLGVLPGGNFSTANVVSGDGAVVGGYSASVNGNRAYRWDAINGMVDLGVLPGGSSSNAQAINYDGSVLAGNLIVGGSYRAFRWDTIGGMANLGVLAGGASSFARGVSADGSIVVGISGSASGNRAFMWDAANGMVSLGLAAGTTTSNAMGVSYDGSVVAGYGNAAGKTHALRWTAATGMVDLGTLAGGANSVAYGVSGDGAVVVGYAITASSGARAFRWDGTNGMVSLGTLAGGTSSYALGTNADGSVVVGYDVSVGGNRAFRWDANGMIDLGVLAGGTFAQAIGVSANGNIVVGNSDSASGTRAFIWQGVILDLVNTQTAIAQSAADLAAAAESRNGAVMFSLGRELEVARTGGYAKGGLGSALPMAIRLEGSLSANSGVNDTAFAGLTAAFGIGDKLTFGGFVQTGREQTSYNTISQTATETGYGVYLRSGAADKTGLTWKLAAASSSSDATITRQALLLNTEAGTGIAAISSYAASFELGYGINRGKLNLTPFVRVSGGTTDRAGYTEDATITFPVTYDALSETQVTATLGLDGFVALNPRQKIRFGAGLDMDISRTNTPVSGSSLIPGMLTFSIAAPTVINPTRAYASLGYSLDLGRSSTVSLDLGARQSAYVTSLTYSAALGFEMRF